MCCCPKTVTSAKQMQLTVNFQVPAEVGDGDEPEEGVVEEVEEDDEEVPACLVCGILQFCNSWLTAVVNK